jgi:hypothetical protein
MDFYITRVLLQAWNVDNDKTYTAAHFHITRVLLQAWNVDNDKTFTAAHIQAIA